MTVERLREKWPNGVNTFTIGATKAEGGSRSKKIVVGAEAALPFLFEEGPIPHKPAIAFEVWDIEPSDWPEALKKVYQGVFKDPVQWAKKCVSEFGADLICLRLEGINPDGANKSIAQIEGLIKKIKSEIEVPLIILGSGNDDKDNAVLPRCAEILKGERCLFGSVTQDNYKTLTVACLADGHGIIAQSPIDINIAKQLNILISDMGFDPNNIVIDPTIGALGYGMEYAYSIMERARLACLNGDKMLSQPFICFVGFESWRAKEAKAPEKEHPEWGDENERGIIWEATTAVGMLNAGANILVMRHPVAIKETQKYIDQMFLTRT
jgi:acetyl-CoA decarbonylase/synthase complex subunit delta